MPRPQLYLVSEGSVEVRIAGQPPYVVSPDLAAAAPKLLAALEIAVDYVESVAVDDESAAKDLAQIRAAIVKAKGEAL